MNVAASGKPGAKPTVLVSIEIDAPIEVVWSAMTDLHRYREWNPFIVGFDEAPSLPTIGARMLLLVRWQNGKMTRSWETLTRLDPPAEDPMDARSAADGGQRKALLAYTYSSWLARTGIVVATREQAITQVPGRPTVYRTEESFHGLLGRFVPLENIADGFRRHAQALKQRAESLTTAPAMAGGIPQSR